MYIISNMHIYNIIILYTQVHTTCSCVVFTYVYRHMLFVYLDLSLVTMYTYLCALCVCMCAYVHIMWMYVRVCVCVCVYIAFTLWIYEYTCHHKMWLGQWKQGISAHITHRKWYVPWSSLFIIIMFCKLHLISN